MNYKVLYRKYRPNTFENIVGQDYIVKTLQNSIINNNISHAYIFSGPRGTGKTSTAKVFSKAINCCNPKNGSPCEECEFCLNFKENPDIIEIDAASNNGVDEIRNLIDNIKLTPTNGKYKVYIIDEVHMLTTSAFNALLLTLEEPPAHTVFILATTNIESVPITILSRCQRFDFQKITTANIVARLKEISKLESIDIEDDAIEEIASLSEGGMRDALSILDQISKGKEKITLEIIEKNIRTVSKKKINEIIETIENNEIEKFLELVSELRTQSADYKSLIKKLIESLSDRARKVKTSSFRSRLNYSDYKNLVFDLSECLTKININVSAYTIIEMTILDYFQTDSNLSFDNELSKENQTINNDSQISNLKNTEEKPIKKVNHISNDIINIRVNNCFVDAQKQYLELLKKGLDENLLSSTLDGKLKSILEDAEVVAASPKYAIFSCNNAKLKDDANNNLENIEKGIKKILNEDYKVIFIEEKEWLNYKSKYIANLKNGVKYEYMEEVASNINTDDSLLQISDVFDINKVEII